MPRLMKDEAFRATQRAQLHEPHIAPITNYIDHLRAENLWLPYVAPLHGGTNARILTVLRDPGPGTLDDHGSGMLCVENDDQSAETQHHLMDDAGHTPADFTPWNAYPWYINRTPRTTELHRGASALVDLIELLPALKVVLLQGRDAQRAWRIAFATYPQLPRRDFTVLQTYHPSNQALRSPSPAERGRRRNHRAETWQEAAGAIGRRP